MSLCPQRGHHYIHLWIHCISIDARTHTHTSIFKHAASAWRHDTTTPESKYIQGHSGIASQLMENSLFHLLAPFIFQLVSFLCVFLYKYVCHSSCIAYAYFCMCFLNKLEGPGHLESLKVISGYLPAESWCPIAIAAPAASAVVDRISNQLWRDPFLLACLDSPHPRPPSHQTNSSPFSACADRCPSSASTSSPFLTSPLAIFGLLSKLSICNSFRLM